MVHFFKLTSKGEWKSSCGKKYDIATVDDETCSPGSGWFKSLNEAISNKKKAPQNNELAQSEV